MKARPGLHLGFREKHGLENRVVTLHDNRLRVLWTSQEGSFDVGESLIDEWPADDTETLKSTINSCFKRSEPTYVHVKLRSQLWGITMIPLDSCEMPDNKRAALASLAPGVALISISSRLPDHYAEISDDEKELLRLLCEDLTLKQIAKRLLLSESAIDSKIKKLKEKLDAKNIGGMVAAALWGDVI